MCSNETIPEYLRKNGRPVVNTFEDGELVYRRVEKNPIISPDGRAINSLAFRLDDDSYNRDAFCSDYMDVLYDEVHINDKYYFKKWAVVAFSHSSFTKIYTLDDPKDGREFHISIIHSPRDCMYPHCNQVAVVNGSRAKEIPKSIKSKIRERIKDIHRVIKPVTE